MPGGTFSILISKERAITSKHSARTALLSESGNPSGELKSDKQTLPFSLCNPLILIVSVERCGGWGGRGWPGIGVTGGVDGLVGSTGVDGFVGSVGEDGTVGLGPDDGPLGFEGSFGVTGVESDGDAPGEGGRVVFFGSE